MYVCSLIHSLLSSIVVSSPKSHINFSISSSLSISSLADASKFTMNGISHLLLSTVMSATRFCSWISSLYFFSYLFPKSSSTIAVIVCGSSVLTVNS